MSQLGEVVSSHAPLAPSTLSSTMLLKFVLFSCLLQEGMTSLHISSERTGAEDILLVLVSASCDVNARNKLGRTALHLAAKQGNLQNLKTLLDAGCDRNIKDKLGFTAVGLAFKFNQKASADVLLHYKPKRNQSICEETVPCETLSKEDVCENSRHENQKSEAKLFDGSTPVKIQQVGEETFLKFTDNVTNRKALSLKIYHLILTFLTQKGELMDGLVSSTPMRLIESVANNFERKLLNLILTASTSLIRLPLSTYTTAALDDKRRKRCLYDLNLCTFERSGQLRRNLESKLLTKLIQGLQDSLSFSSKPSMIVSEQSLTPCLEWKPQKKEPTVEKLKTSAQRQVESSNGHRAENSLTQSPCDNSALEVPCDLTTLQSLCKENSADIENKACEGCLKKLNKILAVLRDSGKVPEDVYEIESSFVVNNGENCLSRLDHVLSNKSGTPLFAEDTLEAFLQRSDLFIFCLKQKGSLFSTLLNKELPDDGPWVADKIAEIFLRVCVALSSDQHLLLSSAAAVMKSGLSHKHSNPTALGTCILLRMGLLKQEDEVDIVKELQGPLLALENLFAKKYFPRDLASIFASFLCKSSPKLFGLDQLRLQALASAITKEILPYSAQEAESDTGKHFKRICDILAVEGDGELMECIDSLFSRVFVTLKCDVWRIGESILIYLGLLKSEFHIEIVRNLSCALKALHHAVKQSYFPPPLNQLLVCFLRKPNPLLTPYSTQVGELLSTMTVAS